MDSTHTDMDSSVEIISTDESLLERLDPVSAETEALPLASGLTEENAIPSAEDTISTQETLHQNNLLQEGIVVDEAMVEIGGDTLHIDENSDVFMPPPKDVFDAQKSGHLKPRVIQVGMKKKWQAMLQKRNRIICSVPGCHMKFFTLFSFERHYRWCTGEKGEGVERCIYCDGQFLANDWGIVEHISQDHPEKLRQYKDTRRALRRKKVSTKKDVVVYMNNSGTVDKIVSTVGETATVVSAVQTVATEEQPDGTVDSSQSKTQFTTKQFKIRKVESNTEEKKKVKFKSKVTLYPISKVRRRNALREGKKKLLLKVIKPDSDDDDELMPCLRKFPGTLSITQCPQGINVFSPMKKKMLGMVIERTRNWSAPRRTYARKAAPDNLSTVSREENWLLIAGAVKGEQTNPETVFEEQPPEPPIPPPLPLELMKLQEEEDRFQLKAENTGRDTTLQFFQPPEEEEEEEEEEEVDEQHWRPNTDDVMKSNTITIVIENPAGAQEGPQIEEIQMEDGQILEIQPDGAEKATEVAEAVVVEKTRRGLSEISRKTSGGEEIIMKKKGRVVFCMRNHRQFVKNATAESNSLDEECRDCTAADEAAKKPVKTYTRLKKKDMEIQTDPRLPVPNGELTSVLNHQKEIPDSESHLQQSFSATQGMTVPNTSNLDQPTSVTTDLVKERMAPDSASVCNPEVQKPTSAKSNSEIVESLMGEILSVIFSSTPEDLKANKVPILLENHGRKRKLQTGRIPGINTPDASPPVKKKRGRPKKIPEAQSVTIMQVQTNETPPQKKRGRKPKSPNVIATPVNNDLQNPSPIRRSARSRKRKLPHDEQMNERTKPNASGTITLGDVEISGIDLSVITGSDDKKINTTAVSTFQLPPGLEEMSDLDRNAQLAREDGGDDHSLPLKKRRVESVDDGTKSARLESPEASFVTSTPTRRKRGRPPKVKVENTSQVVVVGDENKNRGNGQGQQRSFSTQTVDLSAESVELICSVCKRVFDTKQKARNHIIHCHNGLAKVNDDSPLTKAEKLEGIRHAIKIKKALICPREECHKSLRSSIGYFLHIESCGVEVELVTCEICGNKLKPNSFANHQKIHKRKEEHVVDEEAKANDQPESKRRQASVRAKEKMQEFIKGEDVGGEERSKKERDEDYDEIADEEESRSVKRVPGTMSKKLMRVKLKKWTGKYVEPQQLRLVGSELIQKWEDAIKEDGNVTCNVQDCKKSFECVDEMQQHWQCCGLQLRYKCLLCNFSGTEDVTSIWNHFTTEHSVEEMQEASSAVEESAYKYCIAYIPDDKSDFNPIRPQCMRSASTWTRFFYVEHYMLEVFPKWRPRQEHWWKVTNIEEYLPPFKESVNFKMKNFPEKKTWRSLKLFETLDPGDFSYQMIFNVGGPVWASDWCPEPLSSKGRQYVALDVCLDAEKSHTLRRNEGEKSLLQVWDVGFLHSDSLDEQPRLVLAIAVDYGIVWQMKWCPSGCWDDPDAALSSADHLHRLGLLALACGDGLVRILSIPHPEKLVGKDKTIPMYRTKPVAELIPPSCNSSCVTTWDVSCTSISWQRTDGHKLILSGYSNGMVCRWDLDTRSPLLIMEGTQSPTRMKPSLVFFPHSNTPVLSVVWCTTTKGRFFATAGYDRMVKVWDAENLNTPYHEAKRGLFRNLAWCCYWNGFFGAVDECYNLGMSHTLYKEPGYYGYVQKPISCHNACTWALSVSEWMNIEASVDAAGEVNLTVLSNLEQKPDSQKRFPARRLPVYRIELQPLGRGNFEENASSPGTEPVKPTIELEKSTGDPEKRKDAGSTPSKGIIEREIPADCLENKENETNVSLVINEENDAREKVDVCKTYEETSKKFGLVFIDAPVRKMGTLSPAERKRQSRSDLMNVAVPNQYQLSSVNTVVWSCNYESSGWLFTAGQAGLARLSCLSAFQHLKR